MPTIKIGYQGIAGSNSAVIAARFAAETVPDAQLVPLVNSQPVMDALRQGQIDYGVVAIRNSLAGPVAETVQALRGAPLTLVKTYVLPIHHCLFRRPEVPLSDLRAVTSHEQALRQTAQTRQKLFPQLRPIPAADTALAAQQVATNPQLATTAVLCRAATGAQYGLTLVRANLEDDPHNQTTFAVYRRPSATIL